MQRKGSELTMSARCVNGTLLIANCITRRRQGEVMTGSNLHVALALRRLRHTLAHDN